jgi:hypothetical protein
MTEIVYDFDGVVYKNSYDTNGQKLIQITNNTGKKLDLRIHFYYGSVFFPFAEYKNTIDNGVWIKPMSQHIQPCSYIILYLNDRLPIRMNLLESKNRKKINEKIICVGLNKTGTTSLVENMVDLGFNSWCSSEPVNSLNFSYVNFSNMSIGTAFDLIENTDVDFYKDIPFSCPGISERIITQYPQAKYILTTRDNPKKWVESVKRYWKDYFDQNGFNYKGAFNNYTSYMGIGKFHEPTYLLNMFETWNIDSFEGTIDEKLEQVYLYHNNSVRKTLKAHKCDWIEINVSKEGELKKLTDWLGIENKNKNFFWKNKTE